MSKGNPQKKRTFQDNFIKNWCCSAKNHPKGWSWWKRKARKEFRRKNKEDLQEEISEAQYVKLTDSLGLEYQIKVF